MINKVKEVLTDKRKICISIISGFILSFTAIIGTEVYKTNQIIGLFSNAWVSVKTIALLIGLTILFGIVTLVLFELLAKAEFIKLKKTPYKWWAYLIVFFVSWILIFLSFVIAFRAYYPGNATYDYWGQCNYYFFPELFTKHHPPLHSFIIFWAIKYGTDHGYLAETVYGWLQMAVFSFLIAACITFLLKLRISWPWIALVTLYFVLNPAIAIMSFTTTKDVFFSAAFLGMTVLSFFLCINPEKMFSKPVCLILFDSFVLLSCLFRNNAVYGIILADIVYIFVLRKYWKKIILLLAIPIVCFLLIDKVVYSGIMGIGETEPAEALSVPTMQIATVVVNESDTLTDEEIEFIDKYLVYSTIEDRYNPRFADYTKLYFNNEYYNGHKTEFWGNWLKLGFKHPNAYISAFLTLNIQYWYWGADTIDRYSLRTYIEIGDKNRSEETSLAPRALTFYQRIATYELMETHPILGLVFSLASSIWIVLICILILFFRKKYKMIPIVCPALFLLVTYLGGPVSNFRYIFPIMVIYPIIFILAFLKTDSKA